MPVNKQRNANFLLQFSMPNHHFAILCFGSALDPADYPSLTFCIEEIVAEFNLKLIIASKKWQAKLSNTIVYPYLPLTELLASAAIIIHHGGANTFSESLALGTPQLIIPLTTDQPIQADFLLRAQAGMAIYPSEMSKEKLRYALHMLLMPQSILRSNQEILRRLYAKGDGANNAADLIEKEFISS